MTSFPPPTLTSIHPIHGHLRNCPKTHKSLLPYLKSSNDSPLPQHGVRSPSAGIHNLYDGVSILPNLPLPNLASLSQQHRRLWSSLWTPGFFHLCTSAHALRSAGYAFPSRASHHYFYLFFSAQFRHHPVDGHLMVTQVHAHPFPCFSTLAGFLHTTHHIVLS